MSATGCIGNTILTASGLYLDFANPRTEQISIEDIATGLANCCRFSGQLPDGRLYSVAEHCAIMARLAMARGWSLGAQKIALLHDASEAYMGDCPRPLKQLLPDWRLVEGRLQLVIYETFGIKLGNTMEDVDGTLMCKPRPAHFDLQKVKRLDTEMLKREQEVLFHNAGASWAGFDEIEAAPVVINCFPPKLARQVFIELYDEIFSQAEWSVPA